jgi:hypothetical protein
MKTANLLFSATLTRDPLPSEISPPRAKNKDSISVQLILDLVGSSKMADHVFRCLLSMISLSAFIF